MSAQPLAGRRILVTRRPEQSSSLRERLTELGAEVVEAAAIDVAPPLDLAPLDRALHQLHRYHWLLFTSANAISFVCDRFAALGLDPAARLRSLRIGSVGPQTTAALRKHFPGIDVSVAPDADFRAEGLLAALGDVMGQVFLYPTSDKAREVLPQTLEARGGVVDVVVAYRTVPSPELGERLAACLAEGLDLVTLASPSAVEAYVAAGGSDVEVPAAVIGPVTEQAARTAGLDVRAVASPSTADGLVAAIVSALARRSP
jgi:uroporphyrinogen-III synthase